MADIAVLGLDGKKVAEMQLNDAVFAIEPHQQAIFDAILVYRHSMHQGTHKVKDRSEVRGGGRKPWRQKGTGRARQGSIRAPQWRGGGVVFGPTPRSYTIKMNRKVRRLAMRSILSQKVLDNAVKVVEHLSFDEIKTKKFVEMMNNLELFNKTIFVYTATQDVDNAFLSSRNLGNVLMLTVEQLNVYDISNCDAIVFTKEAAELAGEVFA